MENDNSILTNRRCPVRPCGDGKRENQEKKMKAPDKIYVREFAEGISQMWSSIKATKTTANVQHEYIRKDALLKWLEHAKTIYNMRGANAFELLTLQMITEHINEM